MKLIHSFDLATLQQLLQQPDNSSGNDYLLLDGALNPAILRRVRRSGLPWLSIFTQSNDGSDDLMAASPLLVQFDALAFEPVSKLLSHCDGMPMASLWRSPESLQALAQRLYPWCVVKADDMYFNLRYPDTRRLKDIVAVLNDTQHQQLFGPATRCLLPLRGGGWECLPVSSSDMAAAEKVELDQAQTLALIRAGEADETLYQLQYHSHISPAVLADHYPSVESALQQADRAGLHAPDSRFTHCLAALQPGT